MFLALREASERSNCEDQQKTRTATRLLLRLRFTRTCSVTSGEVVHETACEGVRSNRLTCANRFATDYNLVAEILATES